MSTEITVLFSASSANTYFIAKKGGPALHLNLESGRWIDAETREGGAVAPGTKDNELVLASSAGVVLCRAFTATSSQGRPYIRVYGPPSLREQGNFTPLC